MKVGWIIPFIIFGGALQACGAAMNGQLKTSLVNPYLASAVSFLLITFFFTGAFILFPTPLSRACRSITRSKACESKPARQSFVYIDPIL